MAHTKPHTKKKKAAIQIIGLAVTSYVLLTVVYNDWVMVLSASAMLAICGIPALSGAAYVAAIYHLNIWWFNMNMMWAVDSQWWFKPWQFQPFATYFTLQLLAAMTASTASRWVLTGIVRHQRSSPTSRVDILVASVVTVTVLMSAYFVSNTPDDAHDVNIFESYHLKNVGDLTSAAKNTELPDDERLAAIIMLSGLGSEVVDYPIRTNALKELEMVPMELPKKGHLATRLANLNLEITHREGPIRLPYSTLHIDKMYHYFDLLELIRRSPEVAKGLTTP